jgi:hypothetical protein
VTAFLEFKQYLERLAIGCIHVLDARSRDHAFPTCHLPYTSESDLFLPWSKFLAASEIVNVAQLILEGSSSSGCGCGAAVVSSFHPMFSREMLGKTTMSTKRRWISFS